MDIASETLIPLAAVARRYRSARTGNALDVGTVRRWWRRGIGGVRLGTVLIGGTRYTSEEELRRWRLAVEHRREPVRLRPAPSTRDHERAKRRNDARFGRAP
jgi:hypothetical protein